MEFIINANAKQQVGLMVFIDGLDSNVVLTLTHYYHNGWGTLNTATPCTVWIQTAEGYLCLLSQFMKALSVFNVFIKKWTFSWKNVFNKTIGYYMQSCHHLTMLMRHRYFSTKNRTKITIWYSSTVKRQPHRRPVSVEDEMSEESLQRKQTYKDWHVLAVAFVFFATVYFPLGSIHSLTLKISFITSTEMIADFDCTRNDCANCMHPGSRHTCRGSNNQNVILANAFIMHVAANNC